MPLLMKGVHWNFLFHDVHGWLIHSDLRVQSHCASVV